MAWTIDNLLRKAGLDGICAVFNSGSVRLLNGSSVELAAPTFGATAFGAATTANPSVATANALTADTTITAGTIASIQFRDSGATSRLSGSVGVGTGDFQVADAVIPGTATSVNLGSLTFSLSLS